jgi:hypothetical protein
MKARPYLFASATIFALVSLAHLARLWGHLSFEVDNCVVPMWTSWIGFVVPAGLALWGFMIARRQVY